MIRSNARRWVISYTDTRTTLQDIYITFLCVYNFGGGSNRCARGDNRSGRVRSRAALLLLLLSLRIIIFYCHRRNQLVVIATWWWCCVEWRLCGRRNSVLRNCTLTQTFTPSAQPTSSSSSLVLKFTHTHTHYTLTREYFIRREYGYYMVYKKTAGVLSRSHGLCVFIIWQGRKKTDRFALHAIRGCINMWRPPFELYM